MGVLSSKKGGGVVAYSGTSMAAPHVAGLLLINVELPLNTVEPLLNTDGNALNDPDGVPDPIAHH